MTPSEPSAEQPNPSSSSPRDEEPRADADRDFEADNEADSTPNAGDAEAGGDSFGDDSISAAAGDAAAEITVKELHELKEERDEFKDKFIRKVAELDNVIRRSAKEKSDLAKYGNEGFVKELLPVLDSFDQALPDEGEPQDAGDSKDFAAGILLVKKKLLDVFAKNGVEVIDSKGQPFDPNLHQAIQKVEDASVAVETVSEQYQKGYTLNGRLVRPAMVVVAVPTTPSAANPDPAEPKAGDEPAQS